MQIIKKIYDGHCVKLGFSGTFDTEWPLRSLQCWEKPFCQIDELKPQLTAYHSIFNFSKLCRTNNNKVSCQMNKMHSYGTTHGTAYVIT